MITVGILGGMGPESTVDLMNKILAIGRRQNVLPRLVIDCNPCVPGRVAAIRGEGPTPVPVLQRMARDLIGMGADVLIVACNAAHYYYKEIEAAAEKVPLINMIEEVAASLKEEGVDGLIKVLSTSDVVEELYVRVLTRVGIKVMPLAGSESATVCKIARNVQNEGPNDAGRREMVELIEAMNNTTATHVLLGCSELGLLCSESQKGKGIRVVDPIRIVAQAVICRAVAVR